MKRKYSYLAVLILIVLSILPAGCVSVSDSPVPHLYMPHSIPKGADVKKFDFPKGVFVAIGPIRVPEYMNRPQMVTRQKDGTLHIAQFERWAELVDAAMARMIEENLVLMLPEINTVMFPWNINLPVNYQVAGEVVQMDSDLENNLTLVVRWNIFEADGRRVVFSKRSETVEPIVPHDYSGLCEALSAASAKLSAEIAEQLSIAAKQMEKKG